MGLDYDSLRILSKCLNFFKNYFQKTNRSKDEGELFNADADDDPEFPDEADLQELGNEEVT